MSRAAFLATAGDPFSTSFVLKLWKERWYDEVDQFYVNFNNHCGVPKEVVAEFMAKAVMEPKINLIYHPRGIGNGPPVTEMVHICNQDLILLLEEDGFIFDSGEVNRCFQKIESGLASAVGSPRFSCGVEIGEASKKKYNLNYSGYGDVGPNCWPNFFFCKREDLLKTDLDFGSKRWMPGEYCKELDYTFNDVNCADTFVWMCIQLRALGIGFDPVPQHHADPYEIEHMETREGNWHHATQPFHWIHGGSLSSGWGGYLSDQTPDISAEIVQREVETRCAFWKICADETPGYEEFKKEYYKGIEGLVERAELSWDRINSKIDLYRKIMKL